METLEVHFCQLIEFQQIHAHAYRVANYRIQVYMLFGQLMLHLNGLKA